MVNIMTGISGIALSTHFPNRPVLAIEAIADVKGAIVVCFKQNS